eukprot:TRINITY_DN109878_c0_g1_i1.p1 TRINITY_DN109878_c0_g1~~TRINITY_DN109878_c0_g1_i1.p1  ORF type:complete len:382 (-),score=88.33 TRINITY_DN109878_c0_g1_i1:55-1200(-)
MDPPPPPPPPPAPYDGEVAAADEVHFAVDESCAPMHPEDTGEGFDFPEVAPPPPPPPRAAATSKAKLVLIPLCRKGDRVGIENAITHAGASVEEVDIEGNTPLHVAVEAPKNEIATVQCLLEHMANPNVVNCIGAAPLHYVCLRKTNWRGIANLLLENGAWIDCQTLSGKTALHFAAENQLPELVEVLCLFGANTTLVDTESNSALHLALAKEGGRDTVKRQIMEHLIASEANVQAANLRGIAPIHLACAGGHLKCAQLLAEMRADLCAATARGETCLHMACRAGHAEVAQLILQTVPHIMDQQDADGNTPLHAAAQNGHTAPALLLMRAGAETDIKNNRRQTAYDVASTKGGRDDLSGTHNAELVQVLKEVKKDKNCRQS